MGISCGKSKPEKRVEQVGPEGGNNAMMLKLIKAQCRVVKIADLNSSDSELLKRRSGSNLGAKGNTGTTDALHISS